MLLLLLSVVSLAAQVSRTESVGDAAATTLARIEAIYKLEDTEQLSALAKGEPNAIVRAAATLQLTDPETLLFMLQDREPMVQSAAISALATRVPPDSELWTRAFRSGFEGLQQWGAVMATSDPELLAHAALKGYQGEAREVATLKLNDVELLVRLATENGPTMAGKEAAQRLAELDNADWAYRLAVGETSFPVYSEIQIRAVEHIESQDALKSVATGEVPQQVRYAAIARVSDFDWLLAQARDSEGVEYINARLLSLADPVQAKEWGVDPGFRIWPAAIEALDDQEVLAAIASSERWIPHREAAARKVTDQASLVALLEVEKEEKVRVAALEHLSDANLLAQLAIEDPRPGVRAKAMSRIEDTDFLLALAYTSTQLIDALAAVRSVEDQVELQRLAQEARNSAIRATAAGRVTDAEWLVAWLSDDANVSLRSAVLEQSTDLPVLAHWAVHAFEDSTRSTALRAFIQQGYESEDRSIHDVAHQLRHEVLSRAGQAAWNFDDSGMGANQPLPDLPNRIRTVDEERAAQRYAALAEQIYDGMFERRAALYRMQMEEDPQVWVDQAVSGSFDSLRSAALARIEDPEQLIHVIRESTDFSIVRSAMERMPKSGSRSVSVEGAVLAGSELADQLRDGNTERALSSCRSALKRGDEACLPAMIAALEILESPGLAKDYLSSGHPALIRAARDWSSGRGQRLYAETPALAVEWGSEL